MDANHICAELNETLGKRIIRYKKVVAIEPDGCSANIKAHKKFEQRKKSQMAASHLPISHVKQCWKENGCCYDRGVLEASTEDVFQF